MDQRAILETKTKEQLIEELLERRGEVDRLEIELTETKKALRVEEGESDKYAALVKEVDQMASFLVDHVDLFPTIDALKLAIEKWHERLAGYKALEDRKKR